MDYRKLNHIMAFAVFLAAKANGRLLSVLILCDTSSTYQVLRFPSCFLGKNTNVVNSFVFPS